MRATTFGKAGLAAVAAVMAMGTAAQAQPYGYYGMGASPYGYSYDPCRRDSTNRATAGALIGGAIGAVIGSNAAARNARTEGSLLGGAVGAAIGAGVGNRSAACSPGAAPYTSAPTTSYGYGSRYYPRDDYASRDYGYGDRGSRYGSRYEDDYAYGRGGERYRLADRAADADGCTLAESPIYMPDGRTQTRFVRVCRDSSGRYAVVD